jgi:hypothetical protein
LVACTKGTAACSASASPRPPLRVTDPANERVRLPQQRPCVTNTFQHQTAFGCEVGIGSDSARAVTTCAPALELPGRREEGRDFTVTRDAGGRLSIAAADEFVVPALLEGHERARVTPSTRARHIAPRDRARWIRHGQDPW